MTQTTNSKSVTLYSMSLRESRAIAFAALFIIGNIALPQLCHLVPRGGLTFLPIYFFTLIGAYKYGWRVGLLTALLSPLANSALFGMPAPAVLPIVTIKSVLLAVSAAFVARRSKSVTLLAMLAVVILYQVAGSLIETAMTGSWATGFQDFTLGLPGMALQVLGGYAFIKWILKK